MGIIVWLFGTVIFGYLTYPLTLIVRFIESLF